MSVILLVSVFVIATCGLVYELISSTLASYLLGDSVTQFSTIIGVYLFSMGIGSYLSKFIHRNLTAVFIQVELLIGLVGGFSAALLFVSFEHVAAFRLLMYAVIGIIGTLVGLEIPLLIRILKDRYEFKDLISKVFTFDYIGALLASLLFPLVLVPHLGLVRSSFLFGMLNVAVALWTLHLLKDSLTWVNSLRISAISVMLALVLGFIYSERLMAWAEASMYQDTVVFAKSSPYQRVVLTKSTRDVRLYLNGHLQFSSKDEYRYHEALVHFGMQGLKEPKRVLILGGGDGMAAREALKYPSVEFIQMVDLDATVTDLFKNNDSLSELNGESLRSPKVQILNEDAFLWLKSKQDTFDFVIVDFPDPSNYSVGKLYSTAFFRLLFQKVHRDGAIVVQSTSPYVAPKSFWCVDRTLQSVGFYTTPYHLYVPSFGEWGFVLASKKLFQVPTEFSSTFKFLNAQTASSMLYFPEDMRRVETKINKLNNQVLVHYFDEEWAEYSN